MLVMMMIIIMRFIAVSDEYYDLQS